MHISSSWFFVSMRLVVEEGVINVISTFSEGSPKKLEA